MGKCLSKSKAKSSTKTSVPSNGGPTMTAVLPVHTNNGRTVDCAGPGTSPVAPNETSSPSAVVTRIQPPDRPLADIPGCSSGYHYQRHSSAGHPSQVRSSSGQRVRHGSGGGRSRHGSGQSRGRHRSGSQIDDLVRETLRLIRTLLDK